MYSVITYVTRFYAKNDIYPEEHDQTFLHYLLFSFDYVFGNYDPSSPEDLNLRWIIGIHIGYAFTFGIVMTNVLIAIVNEGYLISKRNSRQVDTGLKIGLVIEAIEFSMLVNYVFSTGKEKKDLRLFIIQNSEEKYRKEVTTYKIHDNILGIKKDVKSIELELQNNTKNFYQKIKKTNQRIGDMEENIKKEIKDLITELRK